MIYVMNGRGEMQGKGEKNEKNSSIVTSRSYGVVFNGLRRRISGDRFCSSVRSGSRRGADRDRRQQLLCRGRGQDQDNLY